MMKNKGLTYALLIVVGLIWYNVFFRVKSNLFGEEEAFIPAPSNIQSIASIRRDTFALKASYRDPFSGVPLQAAPVAGPEMPVERLPPPPPRQDVWPQITYYGQVKKTGSKEPLAILNVDGMQFYLRHGESIFDNYVVNRIFRDSIEMSHGKKKKMIRKLR